jgi:DNA-binding transcriptional ArsR family regulator
LKKYAHPVMEDVSLTTVMQALSDPGRLAIVQELMRAERPLACNEVTLDVSKATLSHHFEVLRAAGLIDTNMEGTKCLSSVRTKELEKHFPGLLTLIKGRKG